MEILNNYFQRYSSKENVVTDNTMRLLNLLREHNIHYYNKFLEKIGVVDKDKSLDIKIVVQEKENKNGSVPDAILTQIGYKIVIEVKLLNNFDLTQLENHLKKLEDTSENKILLTIGKEKMQYKLESQINTKCLEKNIKHINLTYSDIIQILFTIVKDDDDFTNVINDYKSFCESNDILESAYDKMYVFTANNSKTINLKYNLYFRPIQNYEKFSYLGLYSDKKVEYIGKVEKVVTVEFRDNQAFINDEDLNEDDRCRILEAINEYNQFSEGFYYFYLVNEYLKTNFIKVSPYPIYSRKIFNLKDILKTNQNINELSAKSIAEQLKNITWE